MTKIPATMVQLHDQLLEKVEGVVTKLRALRDEPAFEGDPALLDILQGVEASKAKLEGLRHLLE